MESRQSDVVKEIRDLWLKRDFNGLNTYINSHRNDIAELSNPPVIDLTERTNFLVSQQVNVNTFFRKEGNDEFKQLLLDMIWRTAKDPANQGQIKDAFKNLLAAINNGKFMQEVYDDANKQLQAMLQNVTDPNKTQKSQNKDSINAALDLITLVQDRNVELNPSSDTPAPL